MRGTTMQRDSITDHVVPPDDLAGLLLGLTTTPLIKPPNGMRHS
jgi:hypothetical protein